MWETLAYIRRHVTSAQLKTLDSVTGLDSDDELDPDVADQEPLPDNSNTVLPARLGSPDGLDLIQGFELRRHGKQCLRNLRSELIRFIEDQGVREGLPAGKALEDDEFVRVHFPS